MKVNIFGSTGVIGRKTIDLLNKNFPEYKINLLCAKSNYKLLKKQILKYNPKYAFLYDTFEFQKYNGKINNTKILNLNELFYYLSSSKSNFSVLAISGYKSLNFLEQIINNTDNLGIASKEAIVSAGHIFRKKKYFKKTNIFPLDSEHFSLFEFLKSIQKKDSIKKIIVTASGGPFYNKKFKNLHNVKFSDAINHPKWKMGYKNSIDSATLVNKCLEVIEAHYLFDIPFDKIDVLVHPEAIVHSAIEYDNFVTQLNLFKNEMKIPLFNFFKKTRLNANNVNEKYDLKQFSSLNFEKVKKEVFPIYDYFRIIDKTKPQNIIKFNIGNEYAVNLYKNKIIKYTDIYKIIKKVTSLNLYSPVNNIKDIIKYHEKIEKKLQDLNISNL